MFQLWERPGGAASVGFHLRHIAGSVERLFTLAWLSQLIFGVAYWMFPKYRGTPSAWTERLAWSTYLLLNLGLGLRLVLESGRVIAGPSGWFVVSAVLQLAGGWAFVFITWPRVRGK